MVGDCGNAVFNVAIRTAVISGRAGKGGRGKIRGGVVDYSVGAGIVAESRAREEWEETLEKAAVLSGGAGRGAEIQGEGEVVQEGTA